MKKLLCALLVVVLLSACAACPPLPPEPVVETIELLEDFQMTVTLGQSVYSAADMDPESPLYFSAKLAYTGPEPGVRIIHGLPIIYYNICRDGRDIGYNAVATVECSTEMVPRQMILYEWNGKAEYDILGGFPPGEYTLMVTADFDTEDGRSTFSSGDVTIPFTVE